MEKSSAHTHERNRGQHRSLYLLTIWHRWPIVCPVIHLYSLLSNHPRILRSVLSKRAKSSSFYDSIDILSAVPTRGSEWPSHCLWIANGPENCIITSNRANVTLTTGPQIWCSYTEYTGEVSEYVYCCRGCTDVPRPCLSGVVAFSHPV